MECSHLQKASTGRKLPPAENFHRQKTSTCRKLSPAESSHLQKALTNGGKAITWP